MSDYERLRTLSRFIRGQANLTDGHPSKNGPGNVHLNHDEAVLAADALDEHCQQLGSIENPFWRWSTLAEFFRRHGIITMAQPACFLCDRHAISWPPAKQHPELPNIVVCERCYEAAVGPGPRP